MEDAPQTEIDHFLFWGIYSRRRLTLSTISGVDFVKNH